MPQNPDSSNHAAKIGFKPQGVQIGEQTQASSPLESENTPSRISSANPALVIPPTIIETRESFASIDLKSGSQVLTEADKTLIKLRAISSYEDLENYYKAQDISFSNPVDLFKQVEKDWFDLRERLITEKSNEKLPESFPVFSLQLEGKSFDIIGVAHTFMTGAHYLRMCGTQLLNYPLVLAEQNLKTNFMLLPNLLEIKDHHADGVLQKAWNNLKVIPKNLLFSFRQLKMEYELTNRTINELEVATESVGNLSQEARTASNIFECLLNLPADMPCDLPSHIDLIRREKLNLGYTHNQLRSLYMAELLKNFDTSKFLSLTDEEKAKFPRFQNKWETNAILVGSGHLHEIEYFLTHEPKYGKSVVERAKNHSELLNNSPQEYLNHCQKLDIIDFFMTVGTFAATTWVSLKLLSIGLNIIF